MFKFFASWRKPEKVVETTATATASKFLIKYNDIFKDFLNNCSWYVYFVGVLVILLCTYYYMLDCKRRLHLRNRRENIQRANERLPQRRRPGAIYRDHEIFRNAIRTVRQYMGSGGAQDGKKKALVLKKTRSGLIYGSYRDNE